MSTSNNNYNDYNFFILKGRDNFADNLIKNRWRD